jgi:DNA-binding transcriptional ArsR family regulator
MRVNAADYDLAAAGRAIAEPSRAAMLLRMMDGQAHTARELAEAAGISPSAATPHLRHLIDAAMVTVATTGRQRLHSLASSEVAAAVEALAAVSPLLPVESLRQARTGSRLQRARVCYSHLGGSLAVTLTAELHSAGVIGSLAPGEVGVLHSLDHPLLAELSITGLPHGAGPAVRGCLDWTERTVHLSGRLGSALLAALLSHGWLARRPRDRALLVTPAGAGSLSALGLAASVDGAGP